MYRTGRIIIIFGLCAASVYLVVSGSSNDIKTTDDKRSVSFYFFFDCELLLRDTIAFFLRVFTSFVFCFVLLSLFFLSVIL